MTKYKEVKQSEKTLGFLGGDGDGVTHRVNGGVGENMVL